MNRRLVLMLATIAAAMAASVGGASLASSAPPVDSTTTTTRPPIHYVYVGELDAAYLPIGLKVRSDVLIASDFTIAGRCSAPGSIVHVTGYTTSATDTLLGSDDPLQYNEMVTDDATGAFTIHLASPTSPTSVWFQVICGVEGLCSDMVNSDGSIECATYPNAYLSRVRFVEQLPTPPPADTIPSTL